MTETNEISATNPTLNRTSSIASLNGFVLMPFSIDSKLETDRQKDFDENWQLNFFLILLFAINDAFYQNFCNHIIRSYKPIKLERADTGAGLSVDLLDNIFRKIDKCHFCIADLSIENLNVSMEIGYALAKSKPVIQVNQKDLPLQECFRSSISKFSDLIGRLYYSVEFKQLTELSIWQKLSKEFLEHRKMLYNPVNFFFNISREIAPFADNDMNDKHTTFLGAWIKQNNINANKMDVTDFEQTYEKNIVRQLYPAVLPVWDKLDPSGTEVEYKSIVYSSRDDADFSSVFSNAYRKIRILTTNLQGLVKHISDIQTALKNSMERPIESSEPLKVEILTLDPESEFVNARGRLIGREISEFRKEMKDSLNRFRKDLISNFKETEGNVNIRIYREFPTQITYIVDEFVYSFVVSVNHQSRHNLVSKIEKGRRGVENSFYQHWDTIWARAHDIR